MVLIRLVHWKDEEVAERAERLRKAGYKVETGAVTGGFLREMTANPPAAIVIDLSRLPSHGRDAAVAVRARKSTHRIPIVFVEGDPGKVARIKTLLTDATYTDWKSIGKAVKKAIANPPADPVVPKTCLTGYSQTPLPKKLGIKEGFVVALLGGPERFEKTLGKLPMGVVFKNRMSAKTDLAMWFVKSKSALERRIAGLAPKVPDGGMWIAWPKKASGAKSDLTQNIVRRTGLDSGLVDYKICSIDETWSGLKFSRRKKK